ncbi:MAG: CidA/LrgA family protein [Burkholderiaceae bacterium]
MRFLTLILLCQLAGELVGKGVLSSVPGPVLGMVILFTGLMVKGSVPVGLTETASFILRYLSLLFVPAGVGIMLHFRLLGEDWPAVAVALVVSTLITIAVTAKVMTWLNRSGSEPTASVGAGEP